jgi:hypothetical protein
MQCQHVFVNYSTVKFSNIIGEQEISYIYHFIDAFVVGEKK